MRSDSAAKADNRSSDESNSGIADQIRAQIIILMVFAFIVRLSSLLVNHFAGLHKFSLSAAIIQRLSKLSKYNSGNSAFILLAVAKCHKSAPRNGHLAERDRIISHSGQVEIRRQGP